MNGGSYVILGIVLIILAVAGLIVTQFGMRKWKKRYDTEWERNE